MASFKADLRYQAYFDDANDHAPSSDDEEPCSKPQRGYNAWLSDHTDALLELYNLFKKNGDIMFGRAFFQTGSFDDFARFVYLHTLLI